MRAVLRIAMCAAGLAAFAGLRRSHAPVSNPRRSEGALAYWYWHHPFRLSDREQNLVRQTGVSRLYVHAATLSAVPAGVRWTSIQRWPSTSPVPLYAVLRVDPRVNSRLLAPGSGMELARKLQALPLPAGIAGVQWDADIPTARLSDYGRFLREFHCALPAGWQLSVTALPDWLRAPQLAEVTAAIDELFPQFYGNRWPENGRPVPALWETRSQEAALRPGRFPRGARVWLGLPAYGRCVLRDDRQRTLGVRHDLDPGALLDNPEWSVAATHAFPSPNRGAEPGEDQVELTCAAPAPAGPIDVPSGAQLWFQWPRARPLRDAIDRIRRTAPAEIEGVCLFRWPAPGEPLGMSPELLAGPPEKTAPGRLSLSRTGDRVAVTAHLPADQEPLTTEGVTLQLTGSGVEDEQGMGGLGSDGARWRRPYLRAGEAWEVHARAPHRDVVAELRWRDAGGVERSARCEERRAGGAR